MTSGSGKRTTLAIFDAVLALGISIEVMAALRSVRNPISSLSMPPVVGLKDVAFLVAFITCWHYAFTVLYPHDRYAPALARLFSVMKGASMVALLLASFSLLYHRGSLQPGGLVAAFCVFVLYEVLRSAALNRFADHLSSKNPRRLVILGSGRRASKAWKEIRTRHYASVYLVGFVDNREVHQMAPDFASRYVGKVGALADILVREVVDTMVVALPVRSCHLTIQEAIDVAEGAGVEVIYLNDLFSKRRRHTGATASVFQSLEPRPEWHVVAHLAKRLLDILGASVGLLVLSPLMVAIAVAVKCTSQGPVLFIQRRHGYRRRLFPMFKFRSMVVNAEALLPDLEALNEADGPVFKLAADPRVTRIGAFLRSTSLDELPQLLNVLFGHMSLVGPRPMSTRDVSLMSEAVQMRRFSVRPGMTGLWQVSGRSSTGFSNWILMDGRYIDKWTFSLDIKILIRTVAVVLKRSGAV